MLYIDTALCAYVLYAYSNVCMLYTAQYIYVSVLYAYKCYTHTVGAHSTTPAHTRSLYQHLQFTAFCDIRTHMKGYSPNTSPPAAYSVTMYK